MSSSAPITVVLYIPFGWTRQEFWHRRRSSEAYAEVLRGKGSVLVVEPSVCPVSGWYRPSHRKVVFARVRYGRLRQEADNLFLLTPFVWVPPRWSSHAWVKSLNRHVYARQVQKAVGHISEQGSRVVSWFLRPEDACRLGVAHEDLVVYECYDNYTAADAGLDDHTRKTLLSQEAELLAKSNLLLTTAEALWIEKSELHCNSYLFPNAADTAFFGMVTDRGCVAAPQVESLPHPIIGYLGNISSAHIDIGLMTYLAVKRPGWSFILVGAEQDQEFADGSMYRRFKDLPNVHYLGWINDDIPAYFKPVDVCIVPYNMYSERIRCVNPTKLHEYTAMGKPVVSTDIPGIRSHSDLIYIGRTREEFLCSIERALTEDSPQRVAERLRVAQENTWEKRSLQIIALVEANLAKS